jgi:hypothetical protein
MWSLMCLLMQGASCHSHASDVRLQPTAVAQHSAEPTCMRTSSVLICQTAMVVHVRLQED